VLALPLAFVVVLMQADAQGTPGLRCFLPDTQCLEPLAVLLRRDRGRLVLPWTLHGTSDLRRCQSKGPLHRGLSFLRTGGRVIEAPHLITAEIEDILAIQAQQLVRLRLPAGIRGELLDCQGA